MARVIMPRNKKYLRALEVLGLSELEGQVYLYLLYHGPCGATRIFRSLGFDKSTTYRLLDNLLASGLIQPIGKGYGRKFKIGEPDYVLELAQQRENELSHARQNIAELVANLEVRAADEYKFARIQVYEGIEQVGQTWSAQLNSGEKIVREIGTSSILSNYLQDYQGFMLQHARQRVQKGIFLRSLVGMPDLDELVDFSSDELMQEIKLLPQGFTLQVALSVFGSKVAFHYPNQQRVRGLVLEDEIIAGLVKSLFDQVWQVASPLG